MLSHTIHPDVLLFGTTLQANPPSVVTTSHSSEPNSLADKIKRFYGPPPMTTEFEEKDELWDLYSRFLQDIDGMC